MRLLALRLAVALGLRDLRPLSEGQVRGILARWARLRDGSGHTGDLGMPTGGPTREPAWLLWCGTVASKLGRLPRHTTSAFRGWTCSAPELEAIVCELIEQEKGELEAAKLLAQRRGCRNFGAGREQQIREVQRALGELARSKAYVEAMTVLTWELAAALEDPSFSRADKMLQGKEA